MNSTDILINIRKIVRSINLESKRIQKDYGVSIPQVLCLKYMYSKPGYMASQSEIKEFLNLNSSTVSGIIQRLEKKHFVAKLPKKGDKRVTNLILTQSGETVLNNVPSLLHDRLNARLDRIDAAELENIENVLEKLVSIIKISDVDASPLLTDTI